MIATIVTELAIDFRFLQIFFSILSSKPTVASSSINRFGFYKPSLKNSLSLTQIILSLFHQQKYPVDYLNLVQIHELNNFKHLPNFAITYEIPLRILFLKLSFNKKSS